MTVFDELRERIQKRRIPFWTWRPGYKWCKVCGLWAEEHRHISCEDISALFALFRSAQGDIESDLEPGVRYRFRIPNFTSTNSHPTCKSGGQGTTSDLPRVRGRKQASDA